MKKSFLIYLYFSFIFIFMFSSCQKEDSFSYFDLKQDELGMYYNETQCSDPWYEFSLKFEYNDWGKDRIVKEYLNGKGIAFLDLDYVKAAESNVVTCTECQCYTESVFYLKISKESPDIGVLEKMGFVLMQ